jgi:hypothetical protein
MPGPAGVVAKYGWSTAENPGQNAAQRIAEMVGGKGFQEGKSTWDGIR